MALTLWIGVIAFTILYVYLLDRRYRLAALEDELEEREVAAAIAERVGARPVTGTAGPGGGRPMRLAAQLADADYGWAYVIAGWTLTGAVARRVLRAARRAHPARGADAPAGDRAVTGRRRPRRARRQKRDALHRRRRRLRCSRSSRSSSSRSCSRRTSSTSGRSRRRSRTGTSQGTDRFRLAGAVVPGSIDETGDGVRFALTDGKKTVAVVHQGDPPELFKKNAPVVCEGRGPR